MILVFVYILGSGFPLTFTLDVLERQNTIDGLSAKQEYGQFGADLPLPLPLPPQYHSLGSFDSPFMLGKILSTYLEHSLLCLSSVM